MNYYSFIHNIHFLVCLRTCPYLLWKRVLHRVWSSAFPLVFQYPLVSLRSSSSCLRLLLRLPVTSFYISFNNVFLKAVPTQYVTNPVVFLLFIVCRIFRSSLAPNNNISLLIRSVRLIYILLQHSFKIFRGQNYYYCFLFFIFIFYSVFELASAGLDYTFVPVITDYILWNLKFVSTICKN